MTRSILYTIVVLAVITGCAPTGSSPSASSSQFLVTTQDPPPSSGTPPPCPAASIDGRLIADPRWGLALDESASDLVRQVIWPYGYSVIEDAGRRVLRDESGQIVAGAQDDVTIAGGEYGQSDAWLACGEPPVLAKP